MIRKVFAVWDAKVETFGAPMLLTTNGEAIRTFIDVIKDPQTMISKHPEDYSLFELGSYDTITGKFENVQAPIPLGGAREFVNQ